MRTEKEIREKLEQIEKDLEELNNFYDDDEISKDGFEKKPPNPFKFGVSFKMGIGRGFIE